MWWIIVGALRSGEREILPRLLPWLTLAGPRAAGRLDRPARRGGSRPSGYGSGVASTADRPRGGARPLLRARVAGVALFAAPLGLVAAAAARLAGHSSIAVGASAATCVAAVPFLQALEHYLKRRAELASLVIGGLGYVGLLARAAGAMRRATTASGGLEPEAAAWLELAGRAELLWPASLALSGAALAVFGPLPRGFAVALAAGALALACGEAVASSGLALCGALGVCVACSWLGAATLARPERWRDARV